MSRSSILLTATLAAIATVTPLTASAPLAGRVREAVGARLERELGVTIAARWSPRTGSPVLLRARRGALTGPDSRAPELVARDFLTRFPALLHATADDIAALALVQRVPLTGGGSVVRFHQHVAGQPVDHGHVAVGVTADGRVLHVAAAGVVGVSTADAAALTGARRTAVGAAPILLAAAGPGLHELASPIRQVVVHAADGPRLAWRATVRDKAADQLLEVVVDDATGAVVRRANLTLRAETWGRVFRRSPDGGPHELVRFPDAETYRPEASPLGWTTDDLTEGNNTVVRDDRADDDEQTLGAQAQAAAMPPGLAFDFPFTDSPAADLDASTTQLFYAVNRAHDLFHEAGFDEASGNFQVDNLGRGGVGGDPVLADAQDGDDTNDTQFIPAPEGTSPRLEAYLWDGGTRDAAFDVGLILHEYGHGVSTRLVGGAHDVDCLEGAQAAAAAEGWSDYFAASFLGQPVLGAYATGDPAGLRMVAMDDIPLSGRDYRDFCTYDNDDPDIALCRRHDNGEIWSAVLWRLRERLVDALGPDGAARADRLVIDGMKLTPCRPSLVDARDGLILADLATHDGAFACLIREVAADRWLGYSASSIDGDDPTPVAVDDAWSDCAGMASLRFTRGLEPGAPTALYSCADTVTVAVTDGDAGAGPLQVVVTTSGGDVETLDVIPGSDPAVFLGRLPTDGAAPVVTEDGVLQVLHGETLQASHDDLNPVASVSADAAVSCQARISITDHRLSGSTCDDDAVPGFPGLPGFIDQGESTDLTLTVSNTMALAVEGAVTVTTDEPTLLSVLPTVPIDVRVPGADALGPGTAEVTLRVAAVDDFAGVDGATVVVNLLADGYDGALAYTLPIELHRDYVLEAGLTRASDVEAETVGAVGPAWTTGTLGAGANEWAAVDCNAAPGGAQSYHLGDPTCVGDYADEQPTPWLSPPALDAAALGLVAVKLRRIDFDHDVDLAAAEWRPGRPYLDADVVALHLSNDPGAVVIDDGLAFAFDALAAWGNIVGFSFSLSGNTTGFEAQSVDVTDDDLADLDPAQPVFVTWSFLPDVTPPAFGGNPPVDVQARGYYLDDVVLTYDGVRVVPATSACAAGPTPFAQPALTATVGDAACPGDVVVIDAADSEAVGCGAAAILEHRFLAGGTPVPCFDDPAGTAPRTQDIDGWGLGATCHDFPATDTVYAVEVRCQASPGVTDARSVAVRVLMGAAVVRSEPSTSCRAEPVVVDAADSSLAGCPSELEYRFRDAIGGGTLDCDGDTTPDDWSAASTCDLPGSSADVELLVDARCAALPDCYVSTPATIAALDPVAAAEFDAPGSAPFCPGGLVRVSSASSVVGSCPGEVEYRWTSPTGTDSGWITRDWINLFFSESEDITLTVRCSSEPTCTADAVLAVPVRQGSLSLTTNHDPLACAGDPLLLGLDVAVPLECDGGSAEYLFYRDTFPLDCDSDAMPDDFGPTDTCETQLVAGGAIYRADVRCDAAPACAIATTNTPVSPPNGGRPVGDPAGTLLVTKTEGCPGPGDVLLSWADSGRMPTTFSVLRADSLPLDVVTHRQADVDGLSHVDAGATCDGGGPPWRGALVRFYSVNDRDACTNTVLP